MRPIGRLRMTLDFNSDDNRSGFRAGPAGRPGMTQRLPEPAHQTSPDHSR
jgi:hypothetical protein